MILITIQAISNKDIIVIIENGTISKMEAISILNLALYNLSKNISSLDIIDSFGRNLFKDKDNEKL